MPEDAPRMPCSQTVSTTIRCLQRAMNAYPKEKPCEAAVAVFGREDFISLWVKQTDTLQSDVMAVHQLQDGLLVRQG